MRLLLPIIAAISIGAQSVFFLGVGFLIFDFYSLTYIITPEMSEDASLLTPYIRETFDSYKPFVGIGVLGAVATYIVYLKSEYRALWFLKSTRILAWLWLPIIPIGTLIGIVLLGARREALGAIGQTQRK